MTIVITDKALDGSYEDEAKKLRDHGIIVHTVGWGDVSRCINKQNIISKIIPELPQLAKSPKKQSVGVRFCLLSKIHSYRLLFRQFCHD